MMKVGEDDNYSISSECMTSTNSIQSIPIYEDERNESDFFTSVPKKEKTVHFDLTKIWNKEDHQKLASKNNPHL